MALSRDLILKANKAGLKNPASLRSYYTPVLQVAFELGQQGVDLSGQPTVSGWRYGNIPDSGLSYNYRDRKSERGLSLAQLDGEPEVGSSMWFTDRKKIRVTGLLLPYRGSDGEALVLPYGVDCND